MCENQKCVLKRLNHGNEACHAVKAAQVIYYSVVLCIIYLAALWYGGDAFQAKLYTKICQFHLVSQMLHASFSSYDS